MKKFISGLVLSLLLTFMCMPMQVTASTVITINEVQVKVTIPVPEQTIASLPEVELLTKGIESYKIEWFHMINGVFTYDTMDKNEEFQLGETYYFLVTATPQSGYALASNATIVINNKKVSTQLPNNRQFITAYSEFYKIEKISISSINLKIPVPIHGQMVKENMGIEVLTPNILTDNNPLPWFHLHDSMGTTMNANDRFIKDQNYYQTFLVMATGSYYDLSDAVVYINGQKAEARLESGLYLVVNFPVTAQAVLINEVDIALSSPKINQTVDDLTAPSFSAEGVVMNNISWFYLEGSSYKQMSKYDVFKAGIEYECRMDFGTADGYEFPYGNDKGYLKTTINGKVPPQYSVVSKTRHGAVSELLTLRIDYIEEIFIQLPTPVQGKPTGEFVATTSASGIIKNTVGSVWHHRVNGEVKAMLASEIFAEGEIYYNYFTASIEHGFTFADNVKVFINGEEASKVSFLAGLLGIQAESKDYKLQKMVDSEMKHLTAVLDPDPVKGIINGVPKTVEGLKLPSTVKILTDKGIEDTIVNWNLDACDYDIYKIDEQSFFVHGDVSLPLDVDNLKNVPLLAAVRVNVAALINEITEEPNVETTPPVIIEESTIVFTIGSKIVVKNNLVLPEIDVPAMIINGRTMIPFRYFIETSLGGTADFYAENYMIIASVNGHDIVMTVEDTIVYVDGVAVELTQAPTIVDGRTLVPLRMVETIAKSVGWNPEARQASIII